MRYGLIVEDLEESSLWLQKAMASAFPDIEIASATTVQEAYTAIELRSPQLALVDLDLPDGSGVEVIDKLSQQAAECQSVVTSIFADDYHLFPALRAGACGYLLKDQPLEQVIAALQAIANGEPPLSPTIANRLLRVFNQRDQEAITTSQLTEREQETLLLMSKGLKLSDVADHMGITRNTAAGYVKKIYRKLNVSSRAEAALEAARMGLIGTQL